ncbi:MAG: hypothetical protein KJP19_09720 [Deltaproteobacteria bacterium]|nr:hypothetical protein [Deltaproteobacteria bacterium]
MVESEEQGKLIAWNGLRLVIPQQWETIVRDKRHLIFEQDLHPLLELRWQRSTLSGDSEKKTAAILAQLEKETGNHLTPIPPPAPLGALQKIYDVAAFSLGTSGFPDGAVLICKSCATIILIRFFSGTEDWLAKESNPFQTLGCHLPQGTEPTWAIQDISFQLLEDFHLDTYTFAFGMSRIWFKSSSTDVIFYRLAPASTHLKQSSFEELFRRFNDSTHPIEKSDREHSLVSRHSPHPLQYLLARLSRKKPFTWSHFQHLPEYDRILGLHLTASHPIKQELTIFLLSNYGVIS